MCLHVKGVDLKWFWVNLFVLAGVVLIGLYLTTLLNPINEDLSRIPVVVVLFYAVLIMFKHWRFFVRFEKAGGVSVEVPGVRQVVHVGMDDVARGALVPVIIMFATTFFTVLTDAVVFGLFVSSVLLIVFVIQGAYIVGLEKICFDGGKMGKENE